jgi:hypothetical protein
MNVILLHNNHQNVLTTHVAIHKMVRKRGQVQIVHLINVEWFLHNCVCTLVLITLRMATWVARTCWWLLCNKITFIHPSAFVGLFKKCYTSDQCTEHGTYKTYAKLDWLCIIHVSKLYVKINTNRITDECSVTLCSVLFCMWEWILIIHHKIKTDWGYWRIVCWREYVQVREGSDRKWGIIA